MKIARVQPPPPPPHFTLTFVGDEGWALAAALAAYAESHPSAAGADRWREWAKDIDRELRR